jgi:calcineurin-like phosphoesterase family protein
MNVYVTSDGHLGHAAVIGYCNRPFPSLEAMDHAIIDRWNERVTPEDWVLHLGDFAMGPRTNIPLYRSKLNGRILLVLGNHDRSAKFMREAGFNLVLKRLDLAGFVLTHHPRPELKDRINLHGHVHELYARKGHCINVGVDVRDFRPVTPAELGIELPEIDFEALAHGTVQNPPT